MVVGELGLRRLTVAGLGVTTSEYSREGAKNAKKGMPTFAVFAASRETF